MMVVIIPSSRIARREHRRACGGREQTNGTNSVYFSFVHGQGTNDGRWRSRDLPDAVGREGQERPRGITKDHGVTQKSHARRSQDVLLVETSSTRRARGPIVRLRMSIRVIVRSHGAHRSECVSVRRTSPARISRGSWWTRPFSTTLRGEGPGRRGARRRSPCAQKTDLR